jgi:hypothetical protein
MHDIKLFDSEYVFNKTSGYLNIPLIKLSSDVLSLQYLLLN